jgi:hypothetical protein
MLDGEVCWVSPFALYVSTNDGNVYLDGSYPVNYDYWGEQYLRVLKDSGEYSVDLSAIDHYVKWSGNEQVCQPAIKVSRITSNAEFIDNFSEWAKRLSAENIIAPANPGLYWAKSDKSLYFDLIVSVVVDDETGIKPFLKISKVMNLQGTIIICKPRIWGPEIISPDKRNEVEI